MQNGQSKMDNTKKLAISGKQHRFNNNNVTDCYLCIYIYQNVGVRPTHVAIWTECNHIWLDTEVIWFVTWYSGSPPQYNWIIVKTCGWQSLCICDIFHDILSKRRGWCNSLRAHLGCGPRSGQTKDLIGICCFLATDDVVRSNG